RPDLPALWWIDERTSIEKKLTFAEVVVQGIRAANFFASLGISRGDRVKVILPRVPEWWFSMLGLIRLGAVPIPGTPLLTAKDIRYRVETAEVAAVLTGRDGAAKT